VARWKSRGQSKNPQDDKPTLASQGIDKNLAQQARVLGALSDEKFEAVVADARDAVSRAVKTVQRHFVRRRYKEHASNEACANENYSKKADGDCFK
jgi:hypothetical protein